MGLSSESAHPVSPYCSPAPALPTTQDTGQSFSTPLPLCRPSVLFYPSPALTQARPVPMARGGPSQTTCGIPWSPLLCFRPHQMVPCLLTSISACIVPQTLWLHNLNVAAVCPLPSRKLCFSDSLLAWALPRGSPILCHTSLLCTGDWTPLFCFVHGVCAVNSLSSVSDTLLLGSKV